MTRHHLLQGAHSHLTDAERLYQGWNAVGDDLRVVLTDLEAELRHEANPHRRTKLQGQIEEARTTARAKVERQGATVLEHLQEAREYVDSYRDTARAHRTEDLAHAWRRWEPVVQAQGVGRALTAAAKRKDRLGIAAIREAIPAVVTASVPNAPDGEVDRQVEAALEAADEVERPILEGQDAEWADLRDRLRDAASAHGRAHGLALMVVEGRSRPESIATTRIAAGYAAGEGRVAVAGGAR